MMLLILILCHLTVVITGFKSLYSLNVNYDSINEISQKVSQFKADIHQKPYHRTQISQNLISKPNNLQELNSESANSVPIKNYIVLGLLLLAFSSNQWSRQVLYYLCNFTSASSNDATHFINAALNFDKDFYAFLASFAFTIVFAFTSLFAGSVADRFNRSYILGVSCLVWSLSTACQSIVSESWQLVPLRVIMGFSQAFYNPAAYTLLSDVFPSNMSSSVNGVLSSGIYIGGGLASLSILIDNQFGWKDTLRIVGGTGILISGLLLSLLKDPRKSIDNEKLILDKNIIPSTSSSIASVTADSPSPAAVIIDVFRSLQEVIAIPEVRILLFSSFCRFAAGFTIGIWKAAYIFERYPENIDLFSSTNAVIITAGGLLSTVVGGYIADKISNPVTDNSSTQIIQKRSKAWVPAIGSLVAIPAWSSFILTSDPKIAAISLFVEYLAAECWFGPILSSLYSQVPLNRRGTAQGIFSILLAFANVVPYFIGLATSHKIGLNVDITLGTAILWVVNISYLLSALGFFKFALFEDEKNRKDAKNN